MADKKDDIKEKSFDDFYKSLTEKDAELSNVLIHTRQANEINREIDYLFEANQGLIDERFRNRRQALIPNLSENLLKERLQRMMPPTKKVLIEKNIAMLDAFRLAKKIRKDRYDYWSKHLKIKSEFGDYISDITSFENIDFNSECSKEQIEELKREFDFYVLPEAIDEINCEIKQDGNVDKSRLNYCVRDEVSLDIMKKFVDNQTQRLPDNYEDYVVEKTENFFGQGIRRRVLFEKTKNPTYKSLNKYHRYFNENFGTNFRANRDEYKKEIGYEQDMVEINADMLRGILRNNIL